MKKIGLLVLAAVLAVIAGPRGATQAADNMTTITMNALNESGENGLATITDMGNGELKVTITVSSRMSEPQPAHIHEGTCATPNPQPKYPLNDVVNGKSETVISANMNDLGAMPHLINVHKSVSEPGIYVSCGDIRVVTMVGGTGGATG